MHNSSLRIRHQGLIISSTSSSHLVLQHFCAEALNKLMPRCQKEEDLRYHRHPPQQFIDKSFGGGHIHFLDGLENRSIPAQITSQGRSVTAVQSLLVAMADWK